MAKLHLGSLWLYGTGYAFEEDAYRTYNERSSLERVARTEAGHIPNTILVLMLVRRQTGFYFIPLRTCGGAIM